MMNTMKKLCFPQHEEKILEKENYQVWSAIIMERKSKYY